MNEHDFGESKRCFGLYKSCNAYNSSEKLPKFIHFMRGIVLIIYSISYNWGCFYPLRDSLQITEILRTTSMFFYARYFLSPKQYSIVFFSIAFFFLSVFFYVLVFRPSLLLQRRVSYFVRLIIESLSPIFYILTSCNLQQVIFYFYYKIEYDYLGLVFSILALLIFLFLYWFDTHASSHTIYIQDMPCRGMETYPAFFVNVYLSVSVQFQILYPRFGKTALISISSIILFGEIIHCIVLSRNPYISQLFTAASLSSVSYAILYNIFYIICQVLNLDIANDLVPVVFLICTIGYFIGIGISSKINYACESFDESILYDTKHIGDEELSDLDLDPVTHFSYDLANSQKAIRVMHKMLFNQETKTVDFAKFCILSSANIRVKLEAYRILIILHKQSEFDHDELLSISFRECPFAFKQLLFDMQKEIISLDQYNRLDPETMADLKNDLYQIRVALFSLIDSICTDTQTYLREIVYKFNVARRNFEEHAFSKMLTTPDCYHISLLISKYYEDIMHRTDLAQRWREYSQTLNKPKENDFREKNEKIMKRQSKLDTAKAEGMYSIIKTMNSLSLYGISVTLFVMLISMFFYLIASLYPYQISPVMNADIFSLATLLSLISFKPEHEIATILSQTMAANDSYYVPFNNSIKDLEFSQYIDIDLGQLTEVIDDQITNIRKTLDRNVFPYWEQTAITNYSNLTIRFEFAKFSAGSDFEFLFNNDNKRITYNYMERYNSLTYTFPILLAQIPELVNSMSNSSIITYKWYILSVALLLVEVVIFLLFLIIRRNVELQYYWESLLTIDVKRLTMIRSSLVNGENLVQDHTAGTTSSSDADNLLGSDEIESSGSGQSSDTLSAQNKLAYEEIDEAEITPQKFYFASPMNNVNITIYAVVVIVGSLFVFIGYPFTILKYIKYTGRLLSDSCSVVSSVNHALSLITVYAGINFTAYNDNSRNALKKFVTQQRETLSNVTYNSDFLLKDEIFNIDLHTAQTAIDVIIDYIKQALAMTADTSDITKENLLNLTSTVYPNISDAVFQFYTNTTEIFYKSGQRVFVVKTVLSVVLFVCIFGFICLGSYRAYALYQEDIAIRSILLLLQEKDLSMLARLNVLLNPVKNLAIKTTADDEQNISRQIFTTSTSSVFLLDAEFVVQDVNAAGCQLLKRKKMNIIQSNMRSFIVKPSENDVFRDGYYAMKNYIRRLIDTNGVSAGKDNMFNLLIRADDARITPVFLTVVNLLKVGVWDRSMAFGFIMNDCSEYTQKEQRYLEARQKISKLLNDILPPIIAMRLISKSEQRERAISTDQFPRLMSRARHRSVRVESVERESSGTQSPRQQYRQDSLISRVDKATVIFIGITNFVDWCNRTSHTEIMERLEIISTMLDSTLAKFPTLTKIKTINGVYMAAAGLFNEVTDKTLEHEAVQFAYEGGKKILEQSFFNQNHMSLVIGINTGGPIISGVLGTDKPFFDVWGDAVNVAARLETSAEPNTMQMNYETVQELPHGAFKIRERPGLRLKGKEGLFTAYVIDLVDPECANMCQQNE